jgi:4-hydroxy-tetrahydrodipicolinate synthase
MSSNLQRVRALLKGGLIPAVPVPRQADGSLHESAQSAYTQWMAGQPVAGAAVWVHTGRGLLIPREMRLEVLRSWREALGPDRLIVAGAGALSTAQDYLGTAVRMAEDAAAGGADALLCFAPTVYRSEPAKIVEHHRRLAEVGLPLILFFLYEAAGGVTYTREVLRELFALPGVAGIKMATLDSVMTYQDVARLIGEEFPDTVLVTGEDRFLGYSLLCGAEGALIGMGAALPAAQAALVGCDPEQSPAEFVRLTRAVDRYAQATFRAPLEGYIQRMLWSLVDTGIIPDEAACDPDGPDLEAWERDDITRETERFAQCRPTVISHPA